jgi:hypothetical protein
MVGLCRKAERLDQGNKLANQTQGTWQKRELRSANGKWGTGNSLFSVCTQKD